MGVAKCPYDPADNSTALWVENGNPGNLPALYSGTNAEFTKADAVIFRTDLHNVTSGRTAYKFKRTLKYDSKWLDSKDAFFLLLLSNGCFRKVKLIIGCSCSIVKFKFLFFLTKNLIFYLRFQSVYC